MNSNPNSNQKKFHSDLRIMFWEKHGSRCEIHHVFGSKFKAKLLKEAGVDKAGEWLVIAMHPEDHAAINDYSFEGERALFLEQKRNYENYFKKPIPVPEEVFTYYSLMTSKHQGVKSW